MLSKEDFAVTQALKKRDVYVKDIAAELGVHPKTVSRALRRGSAPSQGGRRGTSKLDPYKPTVDWPLGEGVWNAMVILREIQAEGYQGGMTILRQYVGPKSLLHRFPQADLEAA
jgi:transposase